MKYKLLPLLSLMIIGDAFGSYNVPKSGTYNPFALLDEGRKASLQSEMRQKPETPKTAIENQEIKKDEEGWETAGRKKRKNQKDQERSQTSEEKTPPDIMEVKKKSSRKVEPLPVIRDPILVSQPLQHEAVQSAQPPADFYQETLPITSDWRGEGRSYSRGYYHQYRGQVRGYGRGRWQQHYPYQRPYYDPYYESEWSGPFAQNQYVNRGQVGRGGLQSQSYCLYQGSQRADNWERAFQELNDIRSIKKRGGITEVRKIGERIYEQVWRPDHKQTPIETSTVSTDAPSATDASTVQPFTFKATPEIREISRPVADISTLPFVPKATPEIRDIPISIPIPTNLSTIPEEEY